VSSVRIRRDLLHVLLVDDAPELRVLLRAMLGDRGDVVILEADSGEEALELAAGAPPHLVVMDQNMMGIDGVTTTRELKAIDERIEIIAFTAVPGAEREFARAGATAHFLKDRFNDLIAFIVQRAEAYAAPQAA
jgi:two-component system, NarL family, nitrate/nitrite response regulator NarL